MNSGKELRLSRIINPESKRLLVTPVDDSLLAGPSDKLLELSTTVKELASTGVDAILGFSSIFRQCPKDAYHDTGTILNLTASTTRSYHTRKVQIGTVKQAIRLGADCVAVHVNTTSKYEREMISILGSVGHECSKYGMPLMAIMYPRSEDQDGDNNYEEIKESQPEEYAKLVSHAVRIGVELGADIIKTPYTDNEESFKEVISSSMGIPIIIAGGPFIRKQEIALSKAKSAISAGASGISFGRNVFMRNEGMIDFVSELRKIVHGSG